MKLLANTLSLKPAKLFGIDETKGSIKIGKHADFFVWDPYKTFKSNIDTKNNNLYQFNNKILLGKPCLTYLRGNLTYSENTDSKKQGFCLKSQFIKAKYHN